VDGANDLNDRRSGGVFMVVGHLKAGVTLAEATRRSHSIWIISGKDYPKDERQRAFQWRAQTFWAISFAPGVQHSIAGLMLAGRVEFCWPHAPTWQSVCRARR